MERLSGEEGELVRVLTHGRHADLVRRVEVHVRQLVRETLDLRNGDGGHVIIY